MVGIPGIKIRKWYDQEWVVESLAVIAPLLVLSWGVYDRATDKQAPGWAPWLYVAAVIWGAAAGVLKFRRARRKDAKREREESPADILGCTTVLYAALSHYFLITRKKETKFRITCHRVAKSEGLDNDMRYLEQVVPYVGGKGGPIGRITPIGCGIIGLVARKGKAYACSRTNEKPEDYIQELIEQWGYTEKAAHSLTNDRWSWMGVPIYLDEEETQVTAVIYLDSAEKELFSPKLVQEFTVSACQGIAKFVRTRYK